MIEPGERYIELKRLLPTFAVFFGYFKNRKFCDEPTLWGAFKRCVRWEIYLLRGGADGWYRRKYFADYKTRVHRRLKKKVRFFWWIKWWRHIKKFVKSEAYRQSRLDTVKNREEI